VLRQLLLPHLVNMHVHASTSMCVSY